MIRNITDWFNPLDEANAKTKIDDIITIFAPNALNLTPEERRKYQKLGTATEHWADIVMAIANDNSAVVPVGVDMVEVNKIYGYRKTLQSIVTHKLTLDTMIDDIDMMSGIQLMGWLNRIYNNMVMLAKNGVIPIAGQFTEAKTRYAKSAPNAPNNITIAISGEADENNVKGGNRVVNLGTTVIQLTGGPELSGHIHLGINILAPGDSYVLPSRCNSITLKNMSSTTTASYTIRSK